MSDDDARRKELHRLLDTANTAVRRSIVQKAIEDLNNTSTDTPFIPETVGSGVNTDRLRGSGSATSFRPYSAARERRPSVGILELIPEKRTIMNVRNNVAVAVTRGIDVSLSKLDVAEAFSTTYDHSHPILDIFTKHKFWVSTGLYPQLISFRFIKKWIFRIVEFQCIGAKTVYYSLDKACEADQMRKMVYNSKDGVFSFDLTNEISSEINSMSPKMRFDGIESKEEQKANHTSGASLSPNSKSSSMAGGDSLTIRIDSGIEDFVVIQNFCVKAFQQS